MESGAATHFKVTVPILGTGIHAYIAPQGSRSTERMTAPENLGKDLDINFSLTAATHLVNRIRKREYAKLPWARLAWMGESKYHPLSDDTLLAPAYLHDQWKRVGVIPYPHQLNAARKVIEEFGGRAILADEVGLGKTIEAGLILREYGLRGQVQRTLILCPAALVWQWYHELKEKFLISAGIQRSEYDWERGDVLIASLDTAKREPHASIIHSLDYDMLIVDEAHKLKNERTSNYQFIRGIKKKFCLLLTATPVQNDLRELYNLVTLVAPGTLGSRHGFRHQYVIDKRNPSDPAALRERLSSVMIRNRRGPDTVEMTKRRVQSIPVHLTDKERDLYDALRNTFAYKDPVDPADESVATSALTLLTLQREVCSSTLACAVTLQKMHQKTDHPKRAALLDGLLQKAQNVKEFAKIETALDLIDQIQDRVILFTEYRATQQLLLHRLQQKGITALAFDGSLSSSRKEWTKELFRRYAQVLVSTESGGEGLNFQFCCHVINFDLPWNPMKVEQRIGRVHRLGQTRDVHVYNLATVDTIEEYILYLLYEKIKLFEMAVGELDEILSFTPFKQNTLEKRLAQIVSDAKSPGEIREQLKELASQIEEGRTLKVEAAPISIDTLLHE